MSNKFTFMFALLIAVTVQLRFTDAAVYSQNHHMAMKVVQLQHQLKVIQNMEKVQLQKRCMNATGDQNVVLDAEHARTNLNLCIKLTINQAVMDGMSRFNQWNYHNHIAVDDPVLNAMKTVCLKKSYLVQCQNNYVNAVKICYDDKGEKKLEKARKGFESLLDYICYNDAEQISLFTENGGPACFKQNIKPITDCAVNLSDNISSIINPVLVDSDFNEVARCRTATTFYNCFVDKLKTCGNKTPANVVDGIFKHILKFLMDCDETEHNTEKALVGVV